MKNLKLTSLLTAGILAVCAIPMSAGAEILKGDVNQDGVINSTDGDLMLEFIKIYSNEDYDKYLSEEDIQHYITYGDMNDDGCVTFKDVVLLGEINSDITVNTQMGDVNHDGFIDSVDAVAILEYYADLSANNDDKYTEEEHENFLKYGNVIDSEGNTNMVDCADASVILGMYGENATPLNE